MRRLYLIIDDACCTLKHDVMHGLEFAFLSYSLSSNQSEEICALYFYCSLLFTFTLKDPSWKFIRKSFNDDDDFKDIEPQSLYSGCEQNSDSQYRHWYRYIFGKQFFMAEGKTMGKRLGTEG